MQLPVTRLISGSSLINDLYSDMYIDRSRHHQIKINRAPLGKYLRVPLTNRVRSKSRFVNDFTKEKRRCSCCAKQRSQLFNYRDSDGSRWAKPLRGARTPTRSPIMNRNDRAITNLENSKTQSKIKTLQLEYRNTMYLIRDTWILSRAWGTRNQFPTSI